MERERERGEKRERGMDWDLSWCPVCENPIPSLLIQRHVNNHFELEDAVVVVVVDDDDDDDFKFANQFGVSAPPPPFSAADVLPECSTSRDHQPKHDIHLQISCILSLQSKALFHPIQPGFISLLKTCLDLENSSTSFLSGYVDHFQSTWNEDMGWGCGWRNIQMLTSHLLRERPEARAVLFGASGFVPDIASLQKWLELAWQRGFDMPGSIFFKGKISGSRKWIGTTECAALLRSFGLRARIVDFDTNGRKINVKRVYGPMDRFVVRSDGNNGKNVPRPSDGSLQNSKGYQALIDWVWNYFSKDRPKGFANQNVVVTDKMPLYFQHHGHSRTIVGIQVKHQKNGMKQYNLLVLDPGHRTEALEKSLREKSGWQKFVKRGLHTLRKPQYQLCYVDPGIAHGEEVEQLKTLHSVFLQS